MRALRKIHLLATLLVGVQLVVWTGTGVAFAWFDFGAVRGAGDRAPAPPLDPADVRVSPADAAARAGMPRADAIALARVLDRPWWIVREGDRAAIVDAVDGSARQGIDAAEAARIAERAHARGAHAIATTFALRADDLDGPVWRVRLDDARATDVYVDPRSGLVVAWRNGAWRAFDALWSLHVLGYVDRDRPSHWPMRVLAALAALAALSGAGLLARRARGRARALWIGKGIGHPIPKGERSHVVS